MLGEIPVMKLSNSQIESAIQDIREMVNDVYNKQAAMNESIRAIRVSLGLSPEFTEVAPLQKETIPDTIP